MIVGADIEMGMVFPVVPANVFFLIHPARAVCAPYCFGFIDLSEHSVVCEELGFVGAVIVILLFVLFLVQGLWLAFHAENRYCTLVGIGIMAQIAWQVFCNIAVVTNTLPNTGISLPFFSSGGTSLILLLAEMGVMINIGRGGERARLERENLRAQREQREKEKSDNTIRLDPNMGY